MTAPIVAVDEEVELPRVAVGWCAACATVAPGVPEVVTRADGDRYLRHVCPCGGAIVGPYRWVAGDEYRALLAARWGAA